MEQSEAKESERIGDSELEGGYGRRNGPLWVWDPVKCYGCGYGYLGIWDDLGYNELLQHLHMQLQLFLWELCYV